MFNKRKTKKAKSQPIRRSGTEAANPYMNNKTISSYRVNQSMSFRESKDEDHSSHSKKLNVDHGSLRFKLPVILVSLILVVIAFLSVSIEKQPKVSFYKDTNSPYRSVEQYETMTEEIMGSDLFSNTKITINTKDIERRLMEEFPEVEAASLRLPIVGRKPTLLLAIRQPQLIVITNNSGGVVVDNRGVAISDINSLSSESKQNIPVVIDESGSEVQLGKQILVSEIVDFITQSKHQLDSKNLKISKMTLPVRVNELDISIDGLNYFVKTDTSGDPRLQMGSFIAVKRELEGKGIKPSEYIDVRVEEKAFYK